MAELDHRIKDLIILHLKDELTVEQQLELQQWINASDHNSDVFRRLTGPDQLIEELKEYDEAKANVRDKIDARIRTFALPESPVSDIRPIRRRRWIYASAAAALLFLFITSYLWLASRFDSSSKARPVPAPVAVRDVAPGGNKATLTLGNGSTIVLENAADGQLAEQGVVQVSKRKNALAYKIVGPHSDATPTVVYNTLTTPRAGQFQVVLPDGTKVWLNNVSSLRYPTSFSGATREVELTGEGYFEVAKNEAKPFTVKLHDITIHVLGTAFNVMAYSDDPESRTTLISGKVSVEVSKTRSTILIPRQQAVIYDSGELLVYSDVDTEEAIAWQRGYFHYTKANIRDVLRQLARWYDVEVEFTIPVPSDYTFDGEIGRDLNLSTILKHLEKKDLHFHIEGKKLIVTR